MSTITAHITTFNCGRELPSISHLGAELFSNSAPSIPPDLIVGVVSVDEILHDAAAFEDADLFAVGMGVGQGWDAAVGVDGCEPGRFLLIGGHVDLAGGVWKAEFCQSDADLDAIWSLAGVEGDVGWWWESVHGECQEFRNVVLR